MRTLILSSSLSPSSLSRRLCEQVADLLGDMGGVEVDFVDLRNVELRPCHLEKSPGMRDLAERIALADNYIFGMGVHCYSINDSLKIVLDTCMKHCEGSFFGILCAAGGEKSYLSTQHLTQMCMNEWRMLQLPRVVYALERDFPLGEAPVEDLAGRLRIFASEFHTIGSKLLA